MRDTNDIGKSIRMPVGYYIATISAVLTMASMYWDNKNFQANATRTMMGIANTTVKVDELNEWSGGPNLPTRATRQFFQNSTPL